MHLSHCLVVLFNVQVSLTHRCLSSTHNNTNVCLTSISLYIRCWCSYQNKHSTNAVLLVVMVQCFVKVIQLDKACRTLIHRHIVVHTKEYLLFLCVQSKHCSVWYRDLYFLRIDYWVIHYSIQMSYSHKYQHQFMCLSFQKLYAACKTAIFVKMISCYTNLSVA